MPSIADDIEALLRTLAQVYAMQGKRREVELLAKAKVEVEQTDYDNWNVQHAEGEAKFWLEPAIAVEGNYGLKPRHLAEALELVQEHADEFRNAWSKHFPG
jgi:hypothetical protein